MNILFLTSSATQSAGDSTSPFILTMAQSLQALGHHVTILAPHASGLAREEQIGGVRFVRFRYAPARWQCLTDGGNTLPKLRRAPLRMLLLPLFALGQAWALYRLLRAEPFDVLHSHWLLPQGLMGGLIARRMKRPHVVMLHGADVFSLQHPLWLWLKKKALARTDCVIANSRATATAIAPLLGDSQPVIVPVGALSSQEPMIPLTERSGFLQPRLLFVGRLFEGKGLPILLQAMKQMDESMALDVYGDGPLRAEYEQLARQLGLGARVQFYGAQLHETVLEAMHQAACLIAPSITTASGWREGQGNAIAEAMLRGLPVIASDSGGISDAVQHDQTGLLVPEADCDALARAITQLLGNLAQAQQLADRAFAFANQHLSAQASAQRIVKLYEAIKGV